MDIELITKSIADLVYSNLKLADSVDRLAHALDQEMDYPGPAVSQPVKKPVELHAVPTGNSEPETDTPDQIYSEGETVVEVKKTKAKKSKKNAAPKSEAVPPVTRETIRALLVDVPRETAKKLVTKYGDNVSKIDDANLADLQADVMAFLSK